MICTSNAFLGVELILPRTFHCSNQAVSLSWSDDLCLFKSIFSALHADQSYTLSSAFFELICSEKLYPRRIPRGSSHMPCMNTYEKYRGESLVRLPRLCESFAGICREGASPNASQPGWTNCRASFRGDWKFAWSSSRPKGQGCKGMATAYCLKTTK